MKKQLLTMFFMALFATTAMANIANPDTAHVTQPDGTVVSLVMRGDEFCHFVTTLDGYTVARNNQGYICYAQKSAGQLVPSSIVAHNVDARTETELAFAESLGRMIKPDMTSAQSELLRIQKEMVATAPDFSAQQPMTRLSGGNYDYSHFRGLVILAEWSDRSFTRSDTKKIFTDMMNKEGFTGFMTEGILKEKINYTGSVRDYFNDNSFGMFAPEFDVIGPIKIEYAQTYPNQTNYASYCAKAVLKAADDLVDYSKYDFNNDGKVDMFYIIYAGGGSNVSGNNEKYIWPYASVMSGYSLDGISFDRYACSTEFYGAEGNKIIDGIGTICHEFSHVLGLPDLYDTDYSTGGQSSDPAKWSVMASGSYLNYSRTPAGYNVYERYASRFMSPQVVTEPGDYSLEPINVSNSALRIESAVKNEFFLLENRQKTRWDAYLPGHGMLVWRVDSTNTTVWKNNKVNASSAHNYMELIRAKGSTATASNDPFPGTGGVTRLDNEGKINISSWAKISTPLFLDNIAETSEGNITLSVVKESNENLTEDFEAIEPVKGSVSNIVGRFCTWELSGGAIGTPSDSVSCAGSQSAGFLRNGYISSSAVNVKVDMLQYTAYNPSKTEVKFRAYYSAPGSGSWIAMKHTDAVEDVNVPADSIVTVTYHVDVPVGSSFKILDASGNRRDTCYIDDITIVYNPKNSPSLSVSTIYDDVTEGPVEIFSLDGVCIARGVVDERLLAPGIYIVRRNGKARKVVVQ